MLIDIIRRVTQAHLLKIRKVLESTHHACTVRKFRLKSRKCHDRSKSAALHKHPHFVEHTCGTASAWYKGNDYYNAVCGWSFLVQRNNRTREEWVAAAH